MGAPYLQEDGSDALVAEIKAIFHRLLKAKKSGVHRVITSVFFKLKVQLLGCWLADSVSCSSVICQSLNDLIVHAVLMLTLQL